jgi:hypothetical protein
VARANQADDEPLHPIRSHQNIRAFTTSLLCQLQWDIQFPRFTMNTTAEAVPVGSEIFAGLALVSISLVVLLILRHYLPLRTTPAYLLVPIFFALFLPASTVLLVPIDLASSANGQDGGSTNRGIWLPKRVLLVSWRITYASFPTYFLIWMPQ